jgi:hypothetical protein
VGGLIVDEQIAIDEGLAFMDGCQIADGGTSQKFTYPGFVLDSAVGAADIIGREGGVIFGHGAVP